jgi:hypothetical protein
MLSEYGLREQQKRSWKRKGGGEREMEVDRIGVGNIDMLVKSSEACEGGGGGCVACMHSAYSCAYLQHHTVSTEA